MRTSGLSGLLFPFDFFQAHLLHVFFPVDFAFEADHSDRSEVDRFSAAVVEGYMTATHALADGFQGPDNVLQLHDAFNGNRILPHVSSLLVRVTFILRAASGAYSKASLIQPG